MNPENEIVQAINALTPWFNHVATDIKEFSKNVASTLERSLVGKSEVNKAALTGLDELSWNFLTNNPFAVGAGTFFAADLVEGDGRHPEWWSRNPSGTIGRLKFDLSPSSDRYYDYRKLPFFSTAASTGEQTVWGPYIDYLGTEEYVLTFTAPFYIHGNFMGVAGCDIRLRDLEPLIMPDLRLIRGNAALINASDHVILGNSGMYLVGERIRPKSSNQYRLALDIPHLGLSLIYTESPRV